MHVGPVDDARFGGVQNDQIGVGARRYAPFLWVHAKQLGGVAARHFNESCQRNAVTRYTQGPEHRHAGF
jgi:hypothetical protein